MISGMKHTQLALTSAVTVAVLAGAAVAAHAAGPSDASSARATTFTVVEHADTDATADTGPKGDSAGDVLAFANPIFDAANKHHVGSANGSCVRSAAGKAYDCQWSVSLKGGQIMVQGPFYDTKDSTLTITGGTGKYVGAQGQMTLHARDAAGSSYDFTYRLSR